MKEFLGQGWSFPVETDASDAIRMTEGESDIEQSIRIILTTAPGERVMRPEFGCGIHDHVFATVDTTTLNLIETDIREALVRWEPRIEVLAVEAELTDRQSGKLEIEINYRVRRTDGEFNLVYPFYLEGA
jgi:phage baseplate assembly protein W